MTFEIRTIGDVCISNPETYKISENWPFVNYLDTGSLTKGVIDSVLKISLNDHLPSRARRKVKPLDILYSTVRPNQEHYGFIDETLENMLVSTGFTVLRAKHGVNPKYVYYLLTQKHITDFLHAVAENSTSAYPSLKSSDIEKLEFRFPKKEVQDLVVKSLTDLDNKITLNRQINQTLEAMAQALFKSWFVDFEPVKAKLSALAAGGSADDANLAAMSAISGKTTEQLLTLKTTNPDQYQQLHATADLFPSEMVDSELGEIPKGWEVGKVGDVAKAKGGYAFKSTDFSDNGCPVIKIKNITENGTVDIEQDSCVIQSATIKTDRFRLYDGDLVMAMTGATVGKIGLINTYGLDVYINQRVAFFESARYGKKISWFLFCLFNTQDAFQFVVGAAQGSAQPNISSTGIEMTPTILPNSHVMECFLSKVDPLFNKWLKNNEESIFLSTLRDELLPKLLSGELLV